jgi:hypothetical protein
MLEAYHATDRRVYNGALCSDMQREAERLKELTARLKQVAPGASCTYFPVEQKYMTFVDNKPVTGNFFFNRQLAIIEAIAVLEGALSA